MKRRTATIIMLGIAAAIACLDLAFVVYMSVELSAIVAGTKFVSQTFRTLAVCAIALNATGAAVVCATAAFCSRTKKQKLPTPANDTDK